MIPQRKWCGPSLLWSLHSYSIYHPPIPLKKGMAQSLLSWMKYKIVDFSWENTQQSYTTTTHTTTAQQTPGNLSLLTVSTAPKSSPPWSPTPAEPWSPTTVDPGSSSDFVEVTGMSGEWEAWSWSPECLKSCSPECLFLWSGSQESLLSLLGGGGVSEMVMTVLVRVEVPRSEGKLEMENPGEGFLSTGEGWSLSNSAWNAGSEIKKTRNSNEAPYMIFKYHISINFSGGSNFGIITEALQLAKIEYR